MSEFVKKTNGSIISTNRVRKLYGEFVAVDDLTFRVGYGETYGLLGPNGAGKTTTMRMLAGLSPVDSGEITISGIDVVRDNRSVREVMGVVTQHDGLDNGLTVFQNLFLFGFLSGLSSKNSKTRAHDVLDFFGLTERSKDNIYELSGGMKRRLAIARSMMSSPKVLVMDEPSTGLDPQSRNRVWEELAMLKDDGVTILVSTHYMEEATVLCDRLAIMDNGKILDEGTPDEMVERHAPKEVAQLRVVPALLRSVREYLVKLEINFREVGALISVTEGSGDRPDLTGLLDREGVQISYRPGNLEDVFLSITGRELRD
ncbi:MAG: ABC transporter ATP-binding protein [SAR202 cluster bacterium]|nr:ABC transporter [Chloroflexota bacterium]MQG88339.1 ABC transporter ATP-binding protein [SAR202 cluster bacterium]|tara:strand:+ start:865 stop:1809 length:945 start_codon:yes stop_codon:yes gene_type:complete